VCLVYGTNRREKKRKEERKNEENKNKKLFVPLTSYISFKRKTKTFFLSCAATRVA
jgi:hypothetical protein